MRPINRICFLALLLLGNNAFAKKAPDKSSNSIEGYVHTLWKYDFRKDISPDNEFQLNRAQIKFENAISSKIFATIEIGYDKSVLEFKDVFLEYKALSFLNFVMGQHKMPFSREELCPNSKLFVIDRGEMNELFDDYGYLGRDIGASIKGEFLTNTFPVTYALGVFNGAGCLVNGDNNDAKKFAERITLDPIKDCLSIGLNSTQQNDSLTGEVITASGADFLYKKKGLSIGSEILYGYADTVNTITGYYLIGAYRIGPFEPGIKFEKINPDSKVNDDDISTITCAVNWYLHQKARLQANLVTYMPEKEENYNIFIIQAQVNF